MPPFLKRLVAKALETRCWVEVTLGIEGVLDRSRGDGNLCRLLIHLDRGITRSIIGTAGLQPSSTIVGTVCASARRVDDLEGPLNIAERIVRHPRPRAAFDSLSDQGPPDRTVRKPQSLAQDDSLPLQAEYPQDQRCGSYSSHIHCFRTGVCRDLVFFSHMGDINARSGGLLP
jgi:hypothetical protein